MMTIRVTDPSRAVGLCFRRTQMQAIKRADYPQTVADWNSWYIQVVEVVEYMAWVNEWIIKYQPCDGRKPYHKVLTAETLHSLKLYMEPHPFDLEVVEEPIVSDPMPELGDPLNDWHVAIRKRQGLPEITEVIDLAAENFHKKLPGYWKEKGILTGPDEFALDDGSTRKEAKDLEDTMYEKRIEIKDHIHLLYGTGYRKITGHISRPLIFTDALDLVDEVWDHGPNRLNIFCLDNKTLHVCPLLVESEISHEAKKYIEIVFERLKRANGESQSPV